MNLIPSQDPLKSLHKGMPFGNDGFDPKGGVKQIQQSLLSLFAMWST